MRPPAGKNQSLLCAIPFVCYKGTIDNRRVTRKGKKTMSSPIAYSIFDIFKQGPGPSSSHTIGPMKAAGDFLKRLPALVEGRACASLNVEIDLYGSLSSTGKGHGTHKALLGGLLGWEPATCDCDQLQHLFENGSTVYAIQLPAGTLPFRLDNIHFAGFKPGLPYENTMVFRLTAGENTLHEAEYYSIGGGFIRRKGDRESPPPSLPFPYSTMDEFKAQQRASGLSLGEIILRNERALTGKTKEEIRNGLHGIIDAMCRSVENGLAADGVLPGPIGLWRKAKTLSTHAEISPRSSVYELAALNAFAIAAAEENAAGHRVVTAPTSGSAGLLAGIIYFMKTFYGTPDTDLREGLLAAALIAFIAKHNASIAGAEVGCQGEIGVAASMAAAFLAHMAGEEMKRVENAAEIALEHHLGMTCDPVDGYVQVPCIERNAVGAVTAFNAYLLATMGDPLRQKVSFDEVVEAMLETGRDMSVKYKETAQGGLAVCCVSC